MKTLVAILLAVIVTPSGAAQLSPVNPRSSGAYDIGRIKVGDEAPDFSLEDVSNKTITLSSFRGKKNVVLVFYRGYW